MHRSIAAALAAVLVVGCDTDEDEFFDIGDAALTRAGCRDVLGSFEADQIRVVTADGEVTELTGADFVIHFRERGFTSAFTDPVFGSEFVSGALAFGDDGVVLGDRALFPGLDDGLQRFECDLDDTRLTLTSRSLDYDFDGDGEFEDARLFASFLRT